MNTLATLWCGWCTDAGHRDRTRLGELRKEADGALVWVDFDHRVRRARSKGWARGRAPRVSAFQMLTHPTVRLPEAPEELPVRCKRHGVGGVSTRDVMDARGSVPVYFKARV